MIMSVTRARESSFISKPFSIYDLVKMQILLLPEVRRKETRSERNKLGKSVVGISGGAREFHWPTLHFALLTAKYRTILITFTANA